MHTIPRLGAVIVIGSLSAVSMLARQVPAPGAPVQGNAPPGPGGGRGGAVGFNPAQAMALASMTIPPAVMQAVTDARTELIRASVAVPAHPADLHATAVALTTA